MTGFFDAVPPRYVKPIVFAAGIAGGFAFAPWNLWPLMLLSLGAMLLFVENAESRKRAFGIGWWWGLGNFLVGQYWIAHAFQYQANMPAWTGIPAVILLSMIMALYPGISAAVAVRFGKSPAARGLAFAGTWMLTEWLRGYLFSGFGWNPLGVVSLPMAGLAQLAAAIGALGLSGILALAAFGLAQAAYRRWRLAAALLLPTVAGALLPLVLTGPTKLTQTRLDIVQANIGQDVKYGPGAVEEAVRRYAALSPLPDGSPRLLIWPEAAIDDVLDERPALRADVARALIGPQDLMLVGAIKAIRANDGRVEGAYNSLYVLGPEGEIRGRYDKRILVPYGEYLPARPLLSLIGIARLVPGAIDFIPGTGPKTLDLGAFPDAGALICYEVVYPEAAGDVVRPGWLLNVSNDAWFSDGGAWMHLAQARMRSIEQGLPMARATPTGVSAIIDPWGRVLQMIGRGEAAHMRVALPAPRPETLFARIGTPLPIGLALLMLGAALLLPRRRDAEIH
ncbi:apolipoprotein N-acyltransferase [Pacificimonas flava]|uniref:Apolipoprotein N-acyltransferase n=1 Tax=Pacificimonas flava TaxID=1234595 RepID=M2SBP7_9SPHN|nr:apolipoprotein N-acyltransferase [Pacificimonas flava]EMD82790.1 Apolipoprotein N-acyltransferase [Pacificimonas flava]MBB5279406.1 apolipoprotein N-acyltransferase [Pacificimonas flava]